MARNLVQEKLTKRRLGFTLVELIIVVVIIGILAAISIIGYSGSKVKAQKAAIARNMIVAVKVAAACQNFGGSFGLPTPDAVICNTSNISAEEEMSLVAGNWPALPPNYSYELISVTPPTVGIRYSADNSLLTCTVKGCGHWSQ